MRICEAFLQSTSAYSQSRYHDTPKLDKKESAQDWEERTWRNRVNATEDGKIYIPPMAFKNSLSEAAKFLSVQIPGKGKSTYTKHFEAGVLVMDPLKLPISKADVHGEWLFVPADGRRGGSNRVKRCFPLIPSWEGPVTFYILDTTITEEVLEYHVRQMGQFIGIGRFRPRNNGFYGRFKVKSFKWTEQQLDMAAD